MRIRIVPAVFDTGTWEVWTIDVATLNGTLRGSFYSEHAANMWALANLG